MQYTREQEVMGQRIRDCRKSNQLTLEELGQILGVQKSAILKYEKGAVDSIPRTKIKIMAEKFGVSPAYLMAFTDDPTPKAEVSECDLIEECYGRDAYKLVQLFFKLNRTGQQKALENLSDLAALDKYTEDEKGVNEKMA